MFEIKKSATGYTVKIAAKRGVFAKAVFQGSLSIDLSAEDAANISKALYTPKKVEKRVEKVISAPAPAVSVTSLEEALSTAMPTETPTSKRKPRKKKDI